MALFWKQGFKDDSDKKNFKCRNDPMKETKTMTQNMNLQVFLLQRFDRPVIISVND